MNKRNYGNDDIYRVIRNSIDSAILIDISYAGIWENMFTDHGLHDFFVTNDYPKNIPYMITSGMFGHMYCDEIRSHVIDIPYLHNTYSLLLLFSDTYKNFRYLENHITSRIISNKIVFGNMQYTDITVVMPRFSIITQHDIKSIFTSLGIIDIFSDRASMKLLSPDKIPITMLHVKTRIDFINNRFKLSDQKRWTDLSGVSYYLNKPFMFCIKYNKSGTILFLGKITDPSSV